MTEVNFGADLAAAEKEFNIGKGSDKFKIKDGDNRVRILSKFAALQNTFKGKQSVKFLYWVWDYEAAALKLAFFPRVITEAIANLQASTEYAFTEVPMPYDINIQAKNAGTIDVEYAIIPARANSDVPQAALDALAKEKSIDEARDAIQAQQTSSDPFQPNPVGDSFALLTPTERWLH